MKNTLITLTSVATLAASANAQTWITPTSATGPATTNPALGAISSLADGDISATGGIVNNFSVSGSQTYTLSFASSQSLNNFAAWQDEGGYASQGIDGFNLTFFDAGNAQIGSTIFGNLAASTTASFDPSPEVFSFATVTGVSSVQLEVTSAHSAANPWSDIREVGFNYDAVPEPSSTALLGLGALGFIARRRR